MLKKRSFPDDWSDLSYSQVSDNVKYLLKNYKKYKISVSEDKTVHIDNVDISSVYTTAILRENFVCVKINSRQITITGDDLYVFNDILNLREMCEYQMLPLRQRVKEWCAYNPVLVASGACSMFVGFVIGILASGHYVGNKIDKPQFKKEIIDTTKQKNDTINYCNQNQK